ncbi:hypothetical protein EG329_012564 [Mollisiaceae sp. DMI_Dod_QoI]|nr:hypothetical protein EG329_012564 [Helotiales sp. DMI_Dod_QoI]
MSFEIRNYNAMGTNDLRECCRKYQPTKLKSDGVKYEMIARLCKADLERAETEIEELEEQQEENRQSGLEEDDKLAERLDELRSFVEQTEDILDKAKNRYRV